MMFITISDGKEKAKNMQKLTDLVGLSENPAENTKQCDFSKRACLKILKIDKIHVIYVYIKNQKQTDELQRIQVGCGLEELWNPCQDGLGQLCSEK